MPLSNKQYPAIDMRELKPEPTRPSTFSCLQQIGSLIVVAILVIVAIVYGISQLIKCNTCDIYFDNGYQNTYLIYIDGKSECIIEPMTCVKRTIGAGKHMVAVYYQDRTGLESLEIYTTTNSRYIYNIGGKNSYVIDEVAYAMYPSAYLTSSSEYPKYRNGERFFSVDVDYMLDEMVPKTIETYGSTTKTQTKTYISRLP